MDLFLCSLMVHQRDGNPKLPDLRDQVSLSNHHRGNETGIPRCLRLEVELKILGGKHFCPF